MITQTSHKAYVKYIFMATRLLNGEIDNIANTKHNM